MTPTTTLDFTSAILDPRITFARSADTASRVNASGYVELVPANQPRFQYNPTTLACVGLLIEPSKTNLIVYSRQFFPPEWIKDGSCTVTANNIVSPENVSNAYTITGATGTQAFAGQSILRYSITGLSSSTTYTFSIYLNLLTSTRATIYVRGASTGNVFNKSAIATPGWQIVQVSYTTGAAETAVALYIGNTTADIGMYGAQFEAGNSATSLINTDWFTTSSTSNNVTTGTKTFTIGLNSNTFGEAITAGAGCRIYQTSNTANRLTASVVSHVGTTLTVSVSTVTGSGSGVTDWTLYIGVATTRNADVATITGTNFSDFWQATRGGASVLATPSTVSGIRPLVQFDDNTANEIIALRGNAADPELQIVDGGTPQAQIDAGTIVANTPYSLTGWWQTNDCKARKDSGAVVTDTTATIPTVTQARIGSDGTNYLNGTIATINYYDSFFGRPIYTRRKNKVFPSLL
jgi:hypothetical protein